MNTDANRNEPVDGVGGACGGHGWDRSVQAGPRTTLNAVARGRWCARHRRAKSTTNELIFNHDAADTGRRSGW